MNVANFYKLPNSTNAVESYNRLCKGSLPDPLGVAMMATYRQDMVAVLQHLAALQGMAVTYEPQTPEAQNVHSSAQSKARAKRRFAEIDNAQGPPDKKSDFGKSCIHGYSVLAQTVCL